VRLGCFFPPAPQGGVAPILRAEQVLGRRLDPVVWFRSWDTREGPGRFRPEHLDGLEDRDVVITWGPWRSGAGPDQPEYAPAGAAPRAAAASPPGSAACSRAPRSSRAWTPCCGSTPARKQTGGPPIPGGSPRRSGRADVAAASTSL